MLAGAKCPHIARAINLNKVKKNLKKTGILSKCSMCKKLEGDLKTAEEMVNDIVNTIILLESMLALKFNAKLFKFAV